MTENNVANHCCGCKEEKDKSILCTEKIDSMISPKFLSYYKKFMIFMGLAGQSVFYLQALKIYMSGHAENVSLEGFLISLFSMVCWIIYGLLIKEKVVIIVNAFAVLGASLVVLSILMC